MLIRPISVTFFFTVHRSTNMSNQINRIRVTTKTTSQQEQTFFFNAFLSFFFRASISSLLNKELMGLRN